MRLREIDEHHRHVQRMEVEGTVALVRDGWLMLRFLLLLLLLAMVVGFFTNPQSGDTRQDRERTTTQQERSR